MELRAKIIGKARIPLEEDPKLDIPAYGGLDPYQYAVPPEYGEEFDMSPVMQESDRVLQDIRSGAQQSLAGLKQPVDPKAQPNIPMSPAASNKAKTDIEVSPEQELSEKQLLRNYLQSLQVRRDKEAEIKDMAKEATERGRLAMLAEGLSESASKMGNILGTPTGSTMQGYGKEIANLEMTGVDQARKAMAESDPTAELGRQAQIASLLESIRASRAKTAQGAEGLENKAASDATRNAILAGKAPRQAGKPAAQKPAALPKPTTEQAKLRQQEREYNERYANIQQNLKNMADMVQRKGTWELLGTHNVDLERLNYNIAIDYAKLVDPESVAREGEVKAAQRYLLPISPSFEHGYTRPETALQIIKNFSNELEGRAKSRSKSLQSIYGVPSATGLQQQGLPQTVPQPPAAGKKVYLKALTGDNRVKAFTEDQAAQLLQQRQPNGQPMFMRVK